MPVSALSVRRATTWPALRAKLGQMALPLAPLVQINSGHIHPAFPPSMLHFWLLTDDELDELAHFYHQRTPGLWTRHYPCPVHWPRGLSLEDKRRKLGKFIGLRGCDSPPPPPSPSSALALSPRLLRNPVAPTIVDRAPGCQGVCRWDADMMMHGPSIFCLACAASRAPPPKLPPAEAAAETPQNRSSPSLLPIRSRCLSQRSRISRRPLPSPRSRLPPLTVDDVIEAARRARLDGDASEEAMRNKTGFYR